MDLDYKYGDVVHTHRHRHSTPDSHLQVVEHSLKDWCNSHFKEHPKISDNDTPCKELNEIESHSIDDGQYDNLKTSELYNLVLELDKLSGKYYCNENRETINFQFQNGNVTIDEENSTPIVINNEKGLISIRFNNDIYKITEKGIIRDKATYDVIKKKIKDNNYETLLKDEKGGICNKVCPYIEITKDKKGGGDLNPKEDYPRTDNSNEEICKKICFKDPNCLALSYQKSSDNRQGTHKDIRWGNRCRLHHKKKSNNFRDQDNEYVGDECTDYTITVDTQYYGGSCFRKYTKEVIEDKIKFKRQELKENNKILEYLFIKEDGNYDSSIIIRLKEIFRNIDKNKLDEEIDDEFKKKEEEELINKKLEKETLELLGIERKMENLERKDQEKQKELIILIILFIIGVMFGIFCVYTQFTLELG